MRTLCSALREYFSLRSPTSMRLMNNLRISGVSSWMELISKQMAEREGVTEDLKARNQME